ncbi:hypothetical protein H0H87_002093 [Tephrocybe sp. NHM501043]|nr:hypothetical protein H0H87_002093 [Tephrocybe sp. NHM501043]
MDYLGSPVAKTLGISPTPLVIPSTPLSPSTPISSPAPVYFSPTKSSRYNIATSPTSVRSAHDVPPSPRNVPSDVESVISSVFDASWPQPPLSQPILSPTASRYRSAPPQPNESATDVLAFGVPLRPAVTPPHRRARPFEGSSISSITEVPDLPQTRQKRTPSVKGLLRTFSAEKVHDARGPVIYMHVVNEVA